MSEIIRIHQRDGDSLEPKADLHLDGRLIRGDEHVADLAIPLLEEEGPDRLLSYLDGPHMLAMIIDVDDLDYDPESTEKAEKWVSYVGPQGKEGWQHAVNGEVRYQPDRPME